MVLTRALCSRSQCDSLPSALRAGCQWRFDWFMGADNPNVTWRKVACPSAITGITGCIRSDDGTAPPPSSVTPTSSTSNAGTTTTTASGSGQTAWGQCGGEGWAGPTTCISGYKCQFTNQWYSQCVPT
ncbi:hypothetical protein FRC03_010250 [Tulasnella sp. 419]|nr:hypothetical protein FRC03_010250 [Tulasnella sp. 419]